MRWPAVDPEAVRKPYREHQLLLPARWTEPPVRVSAVSKRDGYHARRSAGPDNLTPLKAPYYWCRSCNRLVPNANTPFCVKHRGARDRFMRRRRNADVLLARRDVDRLVAVATAIERHRTRYADAPANSSIAFGEWEQLEDNIDRLTADLSTLLANAELMVPTDDIDDDEHAVN